MPEGFGSLRGYMGGGPVNRMSMPRFENDNFVNRLGGIEKIREAAAQMSELKMAIDLTVNDKGGLDAFVQQSAVKHIATLGPPMMKGIHNKYRRNELPNDIQRYTKQPRVRGKSQ
jgi:hypothetical protein